MMEYGLAIAVGILSSFLASLVFLLFLFSLKPKIKISDNIAKGRLEVEESIGYGIKIINKTRSPIMNIEAHLYLVTPAKLPSGEKIRFYKEIPLKKNKLIQLGEFGSEDRIFGELYSNYDWIFVTYENIEEKLQNPASFLEFTVYATHAFSGFGKYYVKNYTKNSIIEGEFEKGNSLKVIKY